MQETRITVVDSLMGSGKSSWAIQFMDSHPDESFIYCTPFLDEISRIQQSCKRTFRDPKRINGRKVEGFNYLLMSGHDIALTHAAFSNSTEETLQYITEGNYILILDEVLDILVDFNDIAAAEVTKGDIRLLLNEGFITSDAYGKVHWLKESYPDSKYSEVERLAKQGNLYYLDSTMLMWQFPPELFQAFKEVYVLTYLFDGSLMKPYFEYRGFSYQLTSVEQTPAGNYCLGPYSNFREQREALKSLISIHHGKQHNDYKNSSLSKSWFSKADSDTIKKLQNNLYNYFHHITKAKSSDILWTCPKAYQAKLKKSGYIIVRKPTKEERNLPQDQLNELLKSLNCYIPCNTRATNLYRNRSTLAYVINIYCNPYIKRYFSNKNTVDGTAITVNEEYFALSAMLQWIWRSQIRDGKPINIYVPSIRMRNLLTDWLDGKI